MKIPLSFLVLVVLLAAISSSAFVKKDAGSADVNANNLKFNAFDGVLNEEIVKQVISDFYVAQYKKDYPGVEVEFGPVRIASKKKKFGVINKNQETTVNPVKVVVTIKVTRSDGSTFESKRGDKPDEVFLFYQNEFDEWSFRVGSSGN